MDVHSLARTNDNVNFLLCMIDVLTKRAWVRPLKDKTMKNIIPASRDIFKEASPEILCSDKGSEFINSQFKKLASEFKIKLSFTVADHYRMAVVERFNQSLRSLMERYMTAYETTRYIYDLQELVKNYNSRYHTATHTSPDSFTDPKDTELTHDRQVEQYMNAMKFERRYKIGDRVHYLIKKDIFEKGSRPNWSATIHKVVMTHKHSYTLDNGEAYKYYELQPAHLAPEEAYYVPPSREPKRPPTQTREQLNKENKQARILRHENIQPKNIITHPRAVRQSTRYQDVFYHYTEANN